MIDPFSPGFFGVRVQNSGEYEQGAPRPAGVHAHLLRQIRAATRKYCHVQGGQENCACRSRSSSWRQEREIVDEAYAGDIIGVFDPGIFSIGDTITVAG